MPPKPQVFKTPDGKEFSVRTEWRDYMMATFFSYRNKKDEPEPLIRLPGSIEGQMYDICDCENSTLVVMDHSEQVQIDKCKNCRIFIAACASSIFIRNCENCTFYTSCRQLRLRDVTDSTFYIYSMAEVHIEFSKGLKFAPFNGGYPEHEKHMKAANLNISNNLWYDIYDHNDPGKTRANWCLLPESEYEEPWFPAGTPCTPAIPRTKPGGVFNSNNPGGDMQSFSLEQMMQDAKKLQVDNKSATVPAPPTAAPAAAAVPPPAVPTTTTAPTAPIPAATIPTATATACAVSKETEASATSCNSAQEKAKVALQAFVGFQAGEDLSMVAHSSFQLILSDGQSLSLQDMSAVAPVAGDELWCVERLQVCAAGHTAFATYWATEGGVESGRVVHCTAVLQRDVSSPLEWLVLTVQKSTARASTNAPARNVV